MISVVSSSGACPGTVRDMRRTRFPRVRSSWAEWAYEAISYFFVAIASGLAEHIIGALWRAGAKAIKRWRKSRRKAAAKRSKVSKNDAE